jgi:integrase
MKVNFRYQKKKNTKKGVIRLDFSYGTNRLRYVFGLSTEEKLWSKAKQRFKSSASNSLELNQRLSFIAKETISIYYELINSNISPSNEMLKEKIKEKISGKSNKRSFYDYVDEFIERSKNTKKANTISEYGYTIRDLKAFEKYSRRRIDWETLDMKFYDAYMDYQYNVKGNSQNLFGKRIKTIKTFLNDAYERGINKHLMYKGFKVLQLETDAIYLNEEELNKIYKLDLKKNKRLERVRDLFTVECNTGLRYQDLMTITKENVLKDSIRIKVSKTGQTLNTLLLPITEKILKKYRYNLPKISNVNYNLYIKEIGELAEINETITKDTYKSGKAISFKRKKYQLITTHTARRSFATNMYKRGYSPVMIMSITGHKKESTFLKYIRITNEESVRMISSNYKKKVV